MTSKILITGGTGYIGSHTALALLLANHDVLVIDNLSNSAKESLNRVAKISGREVLFIEGDIRDRLFLDKIFECHRISAVLHFAGLKSVGESVTQPLIYYDNNIHGSKVLLQAMADAGVLTLVFSSSATVYGDSLVMPISECCPFGPNSPYGRTKLVVEEMLCDLASANPRWRIAILRYFNPAGAHESGLIGEDPNGVPNNLVPFIAQVAAGKFSELSIFGSDYPTPDGTGIRDYVHVVDLAEGHLKALEVLQSRNGVHVWNLGSGHGYSVLEIVRAFEQASGRAVPCRIAPRRDGDIAVCYADSSKATQELGWQAKRGLIEMMSDTWRWQSMNPNGYK